MTITFDNQDRELIRHKLTVLGLTPTAKAIENVLRKVNAALLQQLDSEADYMIQELELV